MIDNFIIINKRFLKNQEEKFSKKLNSQIESSIKTISLNKRKEFEQKIASQMNKEEKSLDILSPSFSSKSKTLKQPLKKICLDSESKLKDE